MAVDRRRFLQAAATVGAVGVGGSVLAACGSDSGSGSSGGASTSGGTSGGSGKALRTLTIATNAAAASWDPDTSEANPHIACWASMYDTLVDPSIPGGFDEAKATMTPDFEPAGMLASSWEVKQNGREWLFTVREGARSNHGNVLTAEDIVWSLQRPIGIGGLGNFFMSLAGIKDPEQIRAVDGRTVSIRLASAPPPYLLSLLALPWLAIYDATEVSRHTNSGDEWGTRWLARNFAGFGPYQLANTTPDGSLTTIERNTGWWGELPAGAAEQQIYQFLPEDSNRLQLLLSGEAQVAFLLTSLQLEEVEKSGRARIESLTTPATFFLGFNNSQKPFDDPEVRRAVLSVIPYDEIISSVYRGQAERWKTIGPPPWFEAATDKFWRYDSGAEAAREVLASVRDPVKLSYTAGSSTEEQVSIMARQALIDAGMKVDVEAVPAAAASEGRRMGRLQFFTDPWDSPAVPSSFYALRQLFTTDAIQPTLNYKNPEIDKIYERGVKASGAERTAALEDAQKVLVDDAPMVPVAWTGTRIGRSADLSGFRSVAGSIVWTRDIHTGS